MILKGRSTVPPDPVEYLVTWNGTMDRQGTCFRLTGRIDHKNTDGTSKPRHRAERQRVYTRRPLLTGTP